MREYVLLPVPNVLVKGLVDRAVPTVVAMLVSPEIVGGALMVIVKASLAVTPKVSVAVTVS